MSTMPLLKAKLKENIRKEATSLPVAMEAQVKTRTRQIALQASEAAGNALTEVDFANLEALGKITGQLKNTYIESVSAAKITSATMLATALTLAGTDASGNKSRLTMTGDALLQIDPADEGAVPTNMAGRGIFNTGSRYAGMWFYDNSAQRGIQMRSDGVSGGRNGRLTFVATRNPTASFSDTNAYANMILASEALVFTNFANASGLSVRNSLSVIGPLRSTSGVETDGAVLAAGQLRTDSGIVTGTGNIATNGAALDLLTGTNGLRTKVQNALEVGTNLRVGGQYNNTGNTAAFGGGVELGGSLSMRGYHRINAAAYSGITTVAAGATVTLPYPGGNDPLWVEVRWRPVGSTWRAATASGATTGVSNNAWNANGVAVTNHNAVTVEVQAIFWA